MHEHLVITGMYRSGTTLLHHLLDGHSKLNVFPVENCIIRDCLFFRNLPRAKERRLTRLVNLVRAGNPDRVVDFILAHEKLGFHLSPAYRLEGSTGSQKIERPFNVDEFRRHLAECVRDLQKTSQERLVIGLYEAYHLSYSIALCSTEHSTEEQILVNKCPEAGFSVDYILGAFPKGKVIHVIRDPRDVLASYKASIPQPLFFPVWRMSFLLDLMRNSFEIAKRFEPSPRVMVVRYEELVKSPEKIMSEVAAFLDISMEKCILYPSIEGHPWFGNSSNKVDGSRKHVGVISQTNKYMSKLNASEVKFVELYLAAEMRDHGYEVDSQLGSLVYMKYRRFIYLFNSFRISSLKFLVSRRLKKYGSKFKC